jgi:hypothetical protein
VSQCSSGIHIGAFYDILVPINDFQTMVETQRKVVLIFAAARVVFRDSETRGQCYIWQLLWELAKRVNILVVRQRLYMQSI